MMVMRLERDICRTANRPFARLVECDRFGMNQAVVGVCALTHDNSGGRQNDTAN